MATAAAFSPDALTSASAADGDLWLETMDDERWPVHVVASSLEGRTEFALQRAGVADRTGIRHVVDSKALESRIDPPHPRAATEGPTHEDAYHTRRATGLAPDV